jgi:hypothetical protein
MNTLSERNPAVKVSKPAQELVRHGSIIYRESQAAFIGRCVSYFYEHNKTEIEAKEAAFFQEADDNRAALVIEPRVEVMGGEDK